MQPNQPQRAIPRSMQFALFITGLLWLLASHSVADHSAQGIANHLNLALIQPLLSEGFFLFLLLVGFATLSWIATRTGNLRKDNALPQRATALREGQQGIVLGWAMLLVAVLPMMLVGDLHPEFWLAPRSWGLALLSLATLAVGTLALEVAFRGYLYARLIAAVGPVFATILLSGIYALFSSFHPNSTSSSVGIAFLLGILFSLAYLRTHGLWLGWGLHFAWTAAMGVLLGLPVGGLETYSSLVTTDSSGAAWITGGPYGPEGALFTVIVLVVGMIVLYRMTTDYAWEYTHPPIVPAGYEMTVAPPPAHTAMEAAAAAKPVPLVQILGTTSTSASTMPVIDEHLRTNSNSDKAE
ncbi:CPBP family intramembrane glutamic endopeptidase [Granulicella mallensis]|uniref:Abortive infection protein n=1 Tax=Granulicella mallensis (strain ATCC BAA-1857 / DSM 23137 / MP5ACTX8) TaxID=682795 RepID=G8NY77_GRAMM|nr:CPBP family intramembrane glutamic endopeptidase [Granulicella mallensis]AEU36751.1 Abortive infection protein [Granulicella mallensis MP5ACTX8]